MHFYPHNYAEILAATVCTACLIKRKTVTNKWFCGFLWLTVAVELSAKMISQKETLYNFFGILEVLFYIFYLRMFSSSKKQAFIFKWINIGFLVFGIANILFFQGIETYNHYTGILGDELITVVCLIVFYDVINGRGQVGSSKSLMLIVASLFLFYSGSFIIDTFYYFLRQRDTNFFGLIYRIVNGYLNVFMYGCFALAFILDIIPNKPRAV